MHRARMLRFVLVFAILAGSVGSAPTGATAETSAQPLGDFTWTVPDRFIDRDGDTYPDYAKTPGDIKLRDWPVDLTACGRFASATTITSYTWRIEVPGEPDDVRTGPECEVRKVFPVLGTYTVTLTVENAAGEQTTISNPVIVKDFLIVSMGDSIGSGEGNPVRMPDGSLGWQNKRCHRSPLAGSARAAHMVERNDPRTSVTFIHVACSGAAMRDNDPKDDEANGGMLDSYKGQEPLKGDVDLPPQIDQVVSIIGTESDGKTLRREIDAVPLSIGANDLEFGNIILWCLLQVACYELKASAIYDGNIGKLESRYAELQAEFKEMLGVDPHEIYQTDYPDPLHDDNGNLCLNILAEITTDELYWAHEHVFPGLTGEVQKNAARDWNIVTVGASEFERHGYCALWDRWFVQMQQSLLLQGNHHGMFHPNMRGHAAYADALYAYLKRDLRLPSDQGHDPQANFAVEALPDGRFRLTDTSTDPEGLVWRWWTVPGVTDRTAPVVEAEAICGKSPAQLRVTNIRNRSAVAQRTLEASGWHLPASADPPPARRFPGDPDAQAIYDASPPAATANATACGNQHASVTGAGARAGQDACLRPERTVPVSEPPDFPCKWSIRTPLGFSDAALPVDGPGAERFVAAANVALYPDDPVPDGLPGRSVDGHVSGGQVYKVTGEPGTQVHGELLVDASVFSASQSSGAGLGDVRVDLLEALPPQPPCAGEDCPSSWPRQLGTVRIDTNSYQCDGLTADWRGSWGDCDLASSAYSVRSSNEQGQVDDRWEEDDDDALMFRRVPQRVPFTVPAGTFIRTSTALGAYATVSKFCPYAETSRLCAVSTHVSASIELVTTTAGAQIVPLVSVGIDPARLPAAPSGVTATGGNGIADITWVAPPQPADPVTGYVVYRDGAVVAETSADTTSIQDSALVEDTTYSYQVAARNALGEGDRSAPASATTAARPGPPQAVKAAPGPGATQATVTWQPPGSDGRSPLTGYQVFRDDALIAEVGPEATTFTDDGLLPLRGYHYEVAAVNAVGSGSRSARVCTTSVPPLPVVPSPCS